MITLATLPAATEQEVFDQCAVHLLTQMEKAQTDKRASCRYKTKEGLKCAAGCFIGEDEYKEEWEHHGWSALSVHQVPLEHADLISDLQGIHDGNPPEQWRHELIAMAITRNFNHKAIESMPKEEPATPSPVDGQDA